MTVIAQLRRYDLVYLATPYTKFIGGIEKAFEEAARLTARLLVDGVAVYSPIVHCHPVAIHGKLDPLDHKIWLPFNGAMMKVSRALAVATMPGWRESFGVTEEIRWFNARWIPVIYFDPVTLEAVDLDG